MSEKYTQAQVDALGKDGKAYKSPDGSWSFPVADAEDLGNAVKSVGMGAGGNAEHDAIRAYVIKRADALGLAKEIPPSWNKDGSLRYARPERQGRSRGRTRVEKRASIHRGREVRSVTFSPQRAANELGVSARSVAPADGPEYIRQLVGHVIRTNATYPVTDRIGTFTERMLPGVVTRSLAEGDTAKMLAEHGGTAFASTDNGTLRVAEDGVGVAIDADLDTRRSDVNDVFLAVQRGDVNQMSAGFTVDKDYWSDDEHRDIHAIRLSDVSIVSFPASPTTDVQVARSDIDAIDEARDLLGALRTAVERSAGDMSETRALGVGDTSSVADALAALHDADDVAMPIIVIALEAIDKSLDLAQSALADVLGVEDPDGDPDDLEPALVPPTDEDRSAAEAEQRAIAVALLELELEAMHMGTHLRVA